MCLGSFVTYVPGLHRPSGESGDERGRVAGYCPPAATRLRKHNGDLRNSFLVVRRLHHAQTCG